MTKVKLTSDMLQFSLDITFQEKKKSLYDVIRQNLQLDIDVQWCPVTADEAENSDTSVSETVSILSKAFLLDENSHYRDAFLWKMSICSP